MSLDFSAAKCYAATAEGQQMQAVHYLSLFMGSKWIREWSRFFPEQVRK